MSETSNSDSPKKRKNESKFDANKLRLLIKEGKTANEIMELLQISHKQILKHHVMRLCSMDSCYYEVIGLFGQNSRKAYVNAKGIITLKNNMIDFGNLELIPDVTQFDVEVDEENHRIILTVINPRNSNEIQSIEEFDGNFADNNL